MTPVSVSSNFFRPSVLPFFTVGEPQKKKNKKYEKGKKKKHNNFKQPQGMIQQYYSVEFIMEQNLKGG